MKRLPSPSVPGSARRQQGFTLIELMVAVTIGLVVAMGFAVSFVNLKSTWGTQDKMSQLQDNERLAMAFLTTSVEEAGYYPNPLAASTVAGSTDATYGAMAAGQGLMGTVLNGTTSASLSTAYSTASGDGILTCQGGTNATGGAVTIRNVFHVDTTKHTLNCLVYANGVTTTAPGAPDAPLVSNVDSMDVRYAIDSDADGSADTIVDASALTTAAAWASVKSVRVTLNFINPNAGVDTAHATIPWVQTINLMNNR